jgi:hypothetical protein
VVRHCLIYCATRFALYPDSELNAARYVLLKERNLLITERATARTAREKFLNPMRLGKVRALPACIVHAQH